MSISSSRSQDYQYKITWCFFNHPVKNSSPQQDSAAPHLLNPKKRFSMRHEKNQRFQAYARFLLDKVTGAVVNKPNIVRRITGAETNYKGGDAGECNFSQLGPY